MLSWNRLILFCLMFNFGVTETIKPNEIAEEITQHFNKLANITVDSNEVYKFITETPNVFQKLFSGMNVFTNVTLEPQSEEFKALKKINAIVYRHLEIAELKTLELSGFSVVGGEMTYEYNEYKYNYKYGLKRFLEGLPVIFNPSERKSLNILQQVWCGMPTIKTLPRITTYLREAMTQNCKADSTRVYVKLVRTLTMLNDKFKHHEEDTEEQKQMKLGILRSLYTMSTYWSLRLLEEYEKNLSTFSTYESALEKLYITSMTKQWNFAPGCFLDSVFHRNLFDRRAVAKFNEMVKLELVRLMVTTSVCSNIIYPDNSEARDVYTMGIKEDILYINSFFRDCIPDKIEVGLRDAEMLTVEYMINEFPGEISQKNSSYAQLADNITNALKHTSGEEAERQILIAPSNTTDSSISTFYGCPTDLCTFIAGKRGVDVMLSRVSYHIGRELELDHVDYTYSNKREIFKILRYNYYKPLSQLVNEFKYKWILPEHSAVIRHKTRFNKKCEFLSYSKFSNRIYSFTYENSEDKNYFDDNTCYSFYFFV